jgi:Ca2+-binding EF-hand superfamily protein
MKTLCAGLAAVLIVCATPTFAATAKKPVTSTAPKHEHVISLKEADKNNDGYISRTEADASPALSKQFATLDTNKDGKLSSQEYAKHK